MNESVQIALVALLGFLCFGQFVYIMVSDNMHRQERKELYSRLMARSLQEYDTSQRNEPQKSRNFVKHGIEQSAKQIYGGGE